MQKWGNQRVNAYYEAKLPKNYPHPNEHTPVSKLEKFIRDKYEEKRWVADIEKEDTAIHSGKECSSKKTMDTVQNSRKKKADTETYSLLYQPRPASISSAFDSTEDFSFTLQPVEKVKHSSNSNTHWPAADTTAWIMSLYSQPQHASVPMGCDQRDVMQ